MSNLTEGLHLFLFQSLKRESRAAYINTHAKHVSYKDLYKQVGLN